MADYTYDLANADAGIRRVSRVRKEIDDRTDALAPVRGTNYFQSDADILDSLADAQDEAPDDANEVEVRLMACAAILDTLATNQAYQLKVGKTLAEDFDGKAVAEAIRAHAKALRGRASASLADRRKLAAEAAAEAARGALSAGSQEVGTEFVF